MSVDKSTVARIAQLARIKVPEEDLDALADELSKIVGWVEQLDEVDTKGVAPMASTVEGIVLRQRDDVVTDGDCREAVLSNAPKTTKGYFVVPKVIK
jgi:aspartyl-tRNA(Asn)/glutamyl-tRNA(Gln) amidotransferase subunit C